MRTFAELVKEALEKRDMTQAELARRSGLSTAKVAQICTGKTKDPRISTVIQVCDGLGMTLDELLNIEEE